jgi:UDP-2,3-diacylglucosamine pyrophosphatase LpxH
MLVVISDTHLSDGSTARNVHASAFQLLCDEIVTAANAKGAIEIHVVLLGDIFDLVRTDYWHRTTTPAERPWGGDLDPATAMNRDTVRNQAQFETVLAGVLATAEAKALIDMLNGLTGQTKDHLPTDVTYVIGNHDRVFNNFPSLQQAVRTALSGVRGVTFANAFRSPEYGVLGRHGHEWDENCHGWSFYNTVLRKKKQPKLERFAPETYQVMAIGEVVTAELMSGLVHYARAAQPSNTPNYPAFIDSFKDINNIRPTLDVFPWMEWFARDQLPSYKAALFEAMKLALDGVLGSSLARRWDDLVTDLLVQGDLTDRLSLVRKRILGGSFDEFRARVGTISKLQDVAERAFPGKDGYEVGAGEEQEWKQWGANPPGPIQFVLYGHTHRARHVAFAASLDQRVRMYVNTGTLLPLIERTVTGEGFATASQMTMAFFYRTEEDMSGRRDRGPTFDLWDGIRRKVYL